VIADRGGRDQHTGPSLADAVEEMACPDDPAAADAGHLASGPSSAGQRFAGQMDDGVRSLERRRLRRGIPAPAAQAAAAEADHVVALLLGRRREAASDESAGARDRDSHLYPIDPGRRYGLPASHRRPRAARFYSESRA